MRCDGSNVPLFRGTAAALIKNLNWHFSFTKMSQTHSRTHANTSDLNSINHSYLLWKRARKQAVRLAVEQRPITGHSYSAAKPIAAARYEEELSPACLADKNRRAHAPHLRCPSKSFRNSFNSLHLLKSPEMPPPQLPTLHFFLLALPFHFAAFFNLIIFFAQLQWLFHQLLLLLALF